MCCPLGIRLLGVAGLCLGTCGAAAIRAPSEANLTAVVLDALCAEIDQAHTQCVVYDDAESGNARFAPSGVMGEPVAPRGATSWPGLTIGHTQENPHSGSTCLRLEWRPPTSVAWVGLAWQHPEHNWGNTGGLNLTGATRVSFWARGATGTERAEFKFKNTYAVLGQDADNQSSPVAGSVRLSADWRQFVITLSGEDLSNVTIPFSWVTNAAQNPSGCTVFIDDITIDHARPHVPRLARSYRPIGVLSPGKEHLANACFLYDNAVAICALVASSEPRHRQAAELLCKAIVVLSNLETDGRLRNAYSCGDLQFDSLDPSQSGAARLPGRLERRPDGGLGDRWLEDEYARGSDCGNMAWAMLALLNAADAGLNGSEEYVAVARRLGEWIIHNAAHTPTGVGFCGGVAIDPSTGALEPIRWQSAEHNIDLAAAFRRLATVEDDAGRRERWRQASQTAEAFVAWCLRHGNRDGGRLVTGTDRGRAEPAMEPKPLDPQTWSVLALPHDSAKYLPALEWAMSACHVTREGVDGLSFSAGDQTIWPEGTAQAALALRSVGRKADAARLLDALDSIATSTREAPGWSGSMPAAFPETVVTGFGWTYERLPHVGANAWYALARLGFNPFTGQRVTD